MGNSNAIKNQFLDRVKGANVLLMLDFDGTVSELVPCHSDAKIREDIKEVILKLQRKSKLKIAFISGRSLKSLKEKVGIEGLIYSGNHGVETEFDSQLVEAERVQEIAQDLRHFVEAFSEDLTQTEGVLVEDKGLSMSIHYRMTAEKLQESVCRRAEEIFNQVAEKIQTFELSHAKKIIEIRPRNVWNKGDVVQFLVGKLSDYLPIFIGDDKTDEDGFKALASIENSLSIKVSNGETSAKHRVENIDDVKLFLEELEKSL